MSTTPRNMNVKKKTLAQRSGGIPFDEQLAAHAGGDARLESLHERYANQLAPASKIRMLRCDCCARTFFDFDGRPAEKAPGKHRCGSQLRWVWVE